MAHGAADYYKMTDILAQSIGNLLVDINAQSLAALSVDIISATLGTIDIDILAQTIGNIKMDINAQSVARLFNRPLYGGCLVSTGYGNVDDLSFAVPITINGTGRIYGGFVEIFAAADVGHSYVYLQFDDVVTEKQDIEDMMRSNIVFPVGSHPYLAQYDQVSDYYSVVMQSDVTFEEKCEVTIFNASGANFGYKAWLSYAVI